MLNSLQRRWLRFYRWQLYVPWNVLRGKDPVIIYTMGKVGSTSIYESLPPSIFWVQVHTLNPEEWEIARKNLENQRENIVLRQAAQVRQYLLAAGRKAKYITVVREPISRNISAFFQNFRHFAGKRPSSLPEDQAAQARLFFERYEHERVLRFFDTEYKTMLGMDVYAYPFPHEQGYQVLNFERGDLLILRTESPDSLKEAAVAKFLNLPDFHLHRANVREDHRNAAAYKAFKQSLVLPQSYLDMLLDSPYCRHFYSPAEIQAVRAEWEAKLK